MPHRATAHRLPRRVALQSARRVVRGDDEQEQCGDVRACHWRDQELPRSAIDSLLEAVTATHRKLDEEDPDGSSAISFACAAPVHIRSRRRRRRRSSRPWALSAEADDDRSVALVAPAGPTCVVNSTRIPGRHAAP